VDDRLTFTSFLSEQPRSLHDAIDAIEPGELPTWQSPLQGLTRLSDLGDQLRVVLVTDGVGWEPDGLRKLVTPASEQQCPALEVFWVHDGEQVPGNLGLAAADLIAANHANELVLMLAVGSSFDEPVNAEAVLYPVGIDAQGKLVEASPIKVIPLQVSSAAGMTPKRLSVAGGPGLYVLRLHRLDGQGNRRPDVLPLDDVAFLSVAASDPMRVRVDSTDRYFFETAVRAFEGGGLFRLALPDEPGDLVIARSDTQRREQDPPLRVEFVTQQEGGEVLDRVLPRVLLPDHPVLRYVPAETLTYDRACRVQAPTGSAVLVSDVSGVPLIWQLRDPVGGAATLWINADPLANDFVLSPYFPVLVRGAVTHLGGRRAPTPATITTGNRIEPPGLRPGESGQLQLADGSLLPITSQTPVRLDHPGFHQIRAAAGEWDLPPSSLHERESSLTFESVLADAPVAQLPSGLPPWFWLTVMGVVVLVAEEASPLSPKEGGLTWRSPSIGRCGVCSCCR
jgi:hypothetical protein